MSVKVTKEFIDAFDFEQHTHTFIDTESCMRDFFVEYMFTTLFEDLPLTEGFTRNFRTYMAALFNATDEDLPDIVFQDAEFTKQYVRTLFGLCHISPYMGDDDVCFAHCTHTGQLRTQFSEDGVLIVHAPSALNAALLLIVSVMRWRVDQQFKYIVDAERDNHNGDTSKDN